MNEIKIDKEFQNLFPTVSREEYIEIFKEISGKSFKSKEETYKWIILKQINKKNLSLYIKSLYALRYKELCEKIENQFTKPGMMPYFMSNTQLAFETKLSRDAIDKIITIDKEASDGQRNRLFNNKASMNKIFYEIRTDLASRRKDAYMNKTRICKECGKNLSFDNFSTGRVICKVCYNNKEYSSYDVIDVKGNVIKASDNIVNLTKKYSEEIENNLYNTDRHIEYTIEDMEEEIKTIVNYFERNITNCINLHKTLLDKYQNHNKIYNMLNLVNTKIDKMKGML
jgi:uncharacterized Zn finger protein (UPF0148 family)